MTILASMFVSPWFAVAGAALASIPIIIHILNRRRFKVVRWAAMEYLLQAMRKNRRRLKFEQWLLLAMRCLLIFLMGLALARPLGCDNSTIAALGGQRTALHVLVIDNSYSMAYEPGGRPDAKTHLDQAKLMAKKILDRLSAGNEEVMIVTASSPIDKDKTVDPHAATPKPTYDLQSARAAIDRIEQTAAATDLDGAFQLAIRTAQEENKLPTKRLYIFTDSTKSAFEGINGKAVEALKQTGPQLAKQFGQPQYFSLGKPGQWNQAVLDVAPAVNLVTTKFSADFTAKVIGYGQGPDPVLQWKMNDVPVGTAKAVKLDLETQPQSLSPGNIVEGGPRIFSATLNGEDRLKIDNTRWRIVDVANEMKVLIVEGTRGIGPMAGSGSFLELALSPPREIDPENPKPSNDKTNSYVAPEPPIGELELSNKILPNYRAVCLADVGQINPAQADQLKTYVEQGGTVMIFGGPAVNADNYNQQLGPRGLLPGRLIKAVTNTDNPAHFDFQPAGNLHPFLQEFKGLTNSGLSTAQIFSYWQVEIPANSNAERVIDYQAEPGKPKDPAITVHSLGKGRVVFFTTTANHEWNMLNPKPIFLALVHEILAGSVGAADRWMNLIVGETLQVPQSLGLTAAPALYDSSKNPILMEATTTQAGVTTYNSAKPLTRPGLYSLNIGSRTIPIAVNVPPSEADVRVISLDAVKKALGDIDLAFEDESVSLAAMKVDTANDWSWAFMAMVFLLAGVECFAAMRFGHYRRGKRIVTTEPAAA